MAPSAAASDQASLQAPNVAAWLRQSSTTYSERWYTSTDDLRASSSSRAGFSTPQPEDLSFLADLKVLDKDRLQAAHAAHTALCTMRMWLAVCWEPVITVMRAMVCAGAYFALLPELDAAVTLRYNDRLFDVQIFAQNRPSFATFGILYLIVTADFGTFTQYYE